MSSLRKTSNNLHKIGQEEEKEVKTPTSATNEPKNMKKKGNYELYSSLNYA